MALVVLVVVVLAGAALAVVTLTRRPSPSATPVASSYLTAWSRRDFAAMALLAEHPPPDFVAIHQRVVGDLNVASLQFRLGAIKTHGSTAEAPFLAHVMLAGLGPWDYRGTVRLARVFGRWTVEWTPATIFPGLPIGGHFSLQRSWLGRGSVLGAGGKVLGGPSDVVTVGLQGNAISSAPAVTMALTQAGIDQAAIATALKTAAAHPTQFVPVADLSDARYQVAKPIIFRVPGTRFQRRAGQTSATPDLAAHIVGPMGPITAEQLRQLGPPYEAGDIVGQSGIEAQYERQLAGTPSGTVDILGATGAVVGHALSLPGKAGVSVQTSIDFHTEQAAEATLNGVKQPAALVALRASTGEVLAAVSRPNSTTFDRALEGQYPPGSTFKVVTSAALLAGGLTPASITTCPKTLAVQGRTFTNFEGESAAQLSFLRAFAISCNTAFINLAGNLTPQALSAAASQFGFGTTPKPGLPAFGGQIPAPVDEVEKVASAIGQGRVLASPLQMAGVAAAVASGSVHAPRLVAGAPDDSAKPVPLAPAVVDGLRSMMAAVVADGSGSPAKVAGGSTVYGKTGTAEFGNATPPMTHAWFIGFRDDVAFAVVVEGGGIGGTVAGPLAAKFLKGL
ncbi:MAG: penicillin-binding transpeptidase domain-containing protein [Actinomycetota bacterium]|nr:penicillin-binding transpeptidase domain-containing protein [Actinomycetota bacterium]